MRASPFRWLFRLLLAVLLLAWAAIALWQAHKRLPPGVHIAGAWRSVAANELRFLRDRTAAEKHAGHSVDQAVQAVTAAFADRAPDKGRLAGAIRAAYAEAP